MDYSPGDDDKCSHGRGRHDGNSDAESHSSEAGKKKRQKLTSVLESKICEFLSLRLYTPVELCTKSRLWFKKFRFLDTEGKLFKNVLNVYSCYLSNLSLKEIASCHYKYRLLAVYNFT